LRKPINLIAQHLISRGPGKIKSGVGKGLLFNAAGCNPGFLFGTSAPLEQQTLVKFLKRGDVFYDLGANAGFYCVIGARQVGETGRVFGFEPTPMLVSRIQQNAILNGFTNVEVVPMAVGATNGMIQFGVLGDLSVENSINAAKHAENTMNVPCITIDAFASEHRPPNLLMMDIEGAELDALKGGMETIRRYLPTMMIEVHWLGEAFKDFYSENLKPLGYVATTYDGAPLPVGTVRYHCLLRVG